MSFVRTPRETADRSPTQRPGKRILWSEAAACTRLVRVTAPKRISPARVLFRRDLERTHVPMDQDTRLHFLRILRDGADLHGLEAFTTDPIRFVHRDEVDWSDPDWVGGVPIPTSVGTPPPATANGGRREMEGPAPLPSKDEVAHASAAARTYYDVLQVRPDAEPEAIKAAYRWFAIKYQPDAAFDPDVARQMAELKAAYAVLGDPIRRKRYDAELLWDGQGMDTSGADHSQSAYTPETMPIKDTERMGRSMTLSSTFGQRLSGALTIAALFLCLLFAPWTIGLSLCSTSNSGIDVWSPPTTLMEYHSVFWDGRSQMMISLGDDISKGTASVSSSLNAGQLAVECGLIVFVGAVLMFVVFKPRS